MIDSLKNAKRTIDAALDGFKVHKDELIAAIDLVERDGNSSNAQKDIYVRPDKITLRKELFTVSQSHEKQIRSQKI